MEEIFTCSECIKFIQEPVQIDCSHSFCKSCAQNLIIINYLSTLRKDIFICPVCEKQTQLNGDMEFAINVNLDRAVNFWV